MTICVCEANGGVLPRQVLIDTDGRPVVSDVMKNKTSSRTLPLIRLNLRLWRRWWAFSPRASIMRKHWQTAGGTPDCPGTLIRRQFMKKDGHPLPSWLFKTGIKPQSRQQ